MAFSLRIRCLIMLLVPLAIAFPMEAKALEFGEVTIEQITSSQYGEWVLFYPGGSLTSNDGDIDKKQYTIRPKIGQFALTVKPPVGASVKIAIYKNDVIASTSTSRSVNFDLAPDDRFRLVIQYIFNVSGTLGVTSNPSGLLFRVLGPDGRTLRAKTPKAFTNIPAGQYTIHVHKPGCVQPRPMNRLVKANEKVVVHIDIECDYGKDAISEKRPLPSRRSVRSSVSNREAERASQHRSHSRISTDGS